MDGRGAPVDNSHMKKHRESGQAAVETAIVMPLFVFTLLGLIQLGLLHQSRLLTKYAAYKAVRAGSLNRASIKTMENAAMAVMLPLMAKSSPRWSGDGRRQPQHMVYNVSTASKYRSAFQDVMSRNKEAFGRKMLTVTVCAPLTQKAMNKDFDDYRLNTDDWKEFETTKLAIQVTTYMPLYIPFANAFIWWAARGENTSAARAQTMKNLRMKTGNTAFNNGEERTAPNGQWTLTELQGEAERGNYIMPVRAAYSMRMHSNFSSNDPPPSTNECHIPWKKN